MVQNTISRYGTCARASTCPYVYICGHAGTFSDALKSQHWSILMVALVVNFAPCSLFRRHYIAICHRSRCHQPAAPAISDKAGGGNFCTSCTVVPLRPIHTEMCRCYVDATQRLYETQTSAWPEEAGNCPRPSLHSLLPCIWMSVEVCQATHT